MKKTILIAGIHGVGKTYFCSLFNNKQYEHYTASSLIKEASSSSIIDKNKMVRDIDSNQQILINAFKELRSQKDTIFLFDGHFVLLTEDMKFQKINLNVFREFDLSKIIVLIDSASNIIERLKNRDKLNHLTVEILDKMQNLEVEHAKFIAEELEIPLCIINLQSNYSDNELITKLSAYI